MIVRTGIESIEGIWVKKWKLILKRAEIGKTIRRSKRLRFQIMRN